MIQGIFLWECCLKLWTEFFGLEIFNSSKDQIHYKFCYYSKISEEKIMTKSFNLHFLAFQHYVKSRKINKILDIKHQRTNFKIMRSPPIKILQKVSFWEKDCSGEFYRCCFLDEKFCSIPKTISIYVHIRCGYIEEMRSEGDGTITFHLYYVRK